MPMAWRHEWSITGVTRPLVNGILSLKVKCLVSDFVFILLKKVTSLIAKMNLQMLCAYLQCP